MQLVDDGLLDLDQPLLNYLPELVIGDMEAAAALTTRHLLTHTAGFEGDIFTDTGRGEDAIEKYVATLTDLPQLFAPGETFSYNNTAFVVLGRLVEVLRGKPYDEVLLERIAGPLGLERVSPSPYEAIRHRAATGHVAGRRRRDDARADLGARAIQRAGRVDARDDADRPARLRADAPRRRHRHRRHPRPQRRVRAGDADPPGRPAPARRHGRRLGSGLGAVRHPAGHRDRPRRRHDRPGSVPPGRPRGRCRDRDADQRRRRLRPLQRRGRHAPHRPHGRGAARAPDPAGRPRAGGRQPLPGPLRRHHLRHHRQPRTPTARSGSTGCPRTSSRRSARSRCASSSSTSPATAHHRRGLPRHPRRLRLHRLGDDASGADKAKYVHYGRVVSRVE